LVVVLFPQEIRLRKSFGDASGVGAPGAHGRHAKPMAPLAPATAAAQMEGGPLASSKRNPTLPNSAGRGPEPSAG
jgi:hypothetical protein